MTLDSFRAAVVALLCASCASYEARPLLPNAELESLCADRFDNVQVEYADPRAPSDPVAVCINPNDGFDEAELASVALVLNPSLRARRAAIGEAQALSITAGLLPNPDLGVFVRPGISGSSGGAMGLDVLFALLRPDERAARRAVADAQIHVVRAEIEAEELLIVSKVRRARIAVLSSEQFVRLFQQEQLLRDEAVTLVRRQRELGETTELALALVELDRATVRRQVREAQATIESGRSSLNALLGVSPTLDLGLVGHGDELAFIIVPDVTDEELDARLLAGRADLRTRAAQYDRAEQELRLAVAQQYPHLGLGPGYERDVEGSQSLGLGVSLELPLFDRNQGDIAEKVATRERARAEYVATLHELRAQAFEARAEMRRARAEVELHQNEILPLIQRSEALFEAAFRLRELSIFEWLTARSRAIQARREQLDALVRYATAAVDLDSATGTPLVTVLTEGSGAGSSGKHE